ncbi:DUF1640 domain-containing protein [Thiocystis violacea]|uniref:DUF1640 domain-containing protein n=1 Tax=Thiocystis violacea TaxID=13725 RepID=UPI0019069A31|nr:DUF1640 domain-containing protein [Thiocystis violacea]MBK1724740.1 DUF1640 domain-containing protein [Thiocystis violacea]
MSSSTIALYEALASAPDERARAKVIAEAFEQLEERYPHLPDLATQGHVREAELRLQKEIAQVRADVEQIRAELKIDIERGRAESRESELRLQKEIEQVRADLTTQIERIKVDLLRWLLPLMLAQVAAIAALVKLL